MNQKQICIESPELEQWSHKNVRILQQVYFINKLRIIVIYRILSSNNFMNNLPTHIRAIKESPMSFSNTTSFFTVVQNHGVEKRNLSAFKVKPGQLNALKQRIKKRNMDKENNQMFRSDNFYTIKKSMIQPLDQPKVIDFGLKKLYLQDFQVGDLIGKGALAKVRVAFHKSTGCVYSLKTIQRQKVEQRMDSFIRSLKIQMFLHHPNVAKVYGLIVEKNYVHLVMQYCADGDMTMNLRQYGNEDKSTKCLLFKISKALDYIHSQRIQHRDLKLQNILLCYGVPKITDFQLSVFSRLPFFGRKTICGSPAYFSPEMIEKHRYNKKADIWCLGIIFFEFLCGYFPFEYNNLEDINHIGTKQIKDFPEDLSKEAVDLIQAMLNKQSDNRIQIDDILAHPFFSNSRQSQ